MPLGLPLQPRHSGTVVQRSDFAARASQRTGLVMTWILLGFPLLHSQRLKIATSPSPSALYSVGAVLNDKTGSFVAFHFKVCCPQKISNSDTTQLLGIDVGTGGHWGHAPPRFCNEQRSALFIFRKCPFFLKEKVPSKCRAPPPSSRCFLRICY